ncbi:Fic family protein [Patescibacteria group bacterium]|nr:Fic family protein [Patescibacteria group bacterium]MBU1886028.1 Fic family protein [Patescibacteria group bacterium]
MFQPKFTLTSLLLDNLSKIERFYGQLEALKIPKKLELNLERDNLIQSTYVSNSIEGNPLSLPEVTNLLLDGRVPANRDEKEVKNYFELLKNLPNMTTKYLDLGLVTDLHSKLLVGVNDEIAGKIRNKKVVVGGYKKNDGELKLVVKHDPPYHKQAQIGDYLTKLLSWSNESSEQAILKAGIFHHQYVYLHPFMDGNGRTCRLLTAFVLLKNEYQINKYFVLDDYYDLDRKEYSDKLNSADQGDKTEWLEYFTSGVRYSLQSSLGRVNNMMKTLKVENRPTSKETEVLAFLEQNQQITSSDLADHLEVSRQQAHKFLASLLEKGLIDKKGETKKSYYFIK